MKLFKNEVGRPSNKVKRTRKIITIFVVLVIILSVILSIYSIKSGIMLFSILKNNSSNLFLEKMNPSEETKNKVYEVRDAVLRTANAYYKQGTQIQYDTYKRNLSCTPEDATSKHYCYVNCSGFVHMVYKNAIGKEVPDTTSGLFDYAKNNNKSNTVIAYTEDLANNYKNQYYKQRLGSFFLENIKNIKPGDVIVWKTSSAHTMLVESVDIDKNEINIIQAGGGAAELEGRYIVETSEDAYESAGALSKETIKIVNNIAMIGSNGKYEEVSRKKIAILRFATSNDYENITGASKIRKDFENIYVAKVSSSDNQDFTRKGRMITYTLKVKNNSKEQIYRDIVIKENIDESKVEVKSITFNGNTKDYVNYKNESKQKDIIRNINVLRPGEETTLKYSVKVKDDINIGDIIISTGIVGKTKQDGDIYGIKTSRIETLVGKGLTSIEKNKLKTKFYNTKDNKLDVSSRKFIKDLYRTINIDLDILGDNRNITIFNSDVKNNSSNLTINYTKVINEKLKNNEYNYIYGNYYGLALSDESSSSNNLARAHGAWNQNTIYELYDRARTLTLDKLEDGDVILTRTIEKDAENKEIINDSGYIYFDSTLYRYNKNGTASLSGESLTVFLRNLIGRDYIILRPYTY